VDVDGVDDRCLRQASNTEDEGHAVHDDEGPQPRDAEEAPEQSAAEAAAEATSTATDQAAETSPEHAAAAQPSLQASEELGAELVRLVRGLRELSATVPQPGRQRLDLPGAAVLGRVGDEGPLRLSTLAERLCLDLSTVSRQVPALERAGWLVREPDPRDRRAQLLRLTEAGQRALAARRRAQAQALAQALPGWTDVEVSDLAARLARLNTDLTAHRAALPDPAHREAS
jgi:DNA-binding MarR family transcriptional regulator